ncbi:hypothetical protein P5V15_005190 [Pogonomyrmex californicus]
MIILHCIICVIILSLRIYIYIYIYYIQNTAHDAQMFNNVKSKTFDMKELINYYDAFVSFCMAEKLNFVNEDGTIRWNEGIAYFKKVVRDTNKLNEITKALLQCKEQEDAKEGATHEKILKIFQCAMPKLKLVRQMM